MIPSNQLRVGNYVDCPTKAEKFCEVEKISRYGKSISLTDNPAGRSFGCELTDIEPIPFSEDILVKFGFKKTHHDTMHNVYLRNDIRVVFELKDINHCDIVKERGFFVPIYVQWVHQFQNLLFWLNDEELKLVL